MLKVKFIVDSQWLLININLDFLNYMEAFLLNYLSFLKYGCFLNMISITTEM